MTGCWEWPALRSNLGYGRLTLNGQAWYAHRLIWTLTNGPIPDGLFVLHHCDNPPCVNPAHLFLGTQADNVHDMTEKGRARGGGLRGSQVGNSKLDEARVAEIKRLRREGIGQKTIAKQFGVSKRMVQFIERGIWWKHVA